MAFIFTKINNYLLTYAFWGIRRGKHRNSNFFLTFLTYQNECPCLAITDFEGVYIQAENQVNLSWKAPEAPSLLGFDIYRNDILLEHVTPTTIFYSDNTSELECGNYKYCVIPVYPSVCNLENECFETSINVGIKNYENHITIYPNPAKDELRITNYELRIMNIEVFDVYGRKQGHSLLVTRHENGEVAINVSALQNGIYLLSIETSTKTTTQKKIIINH